MKITDAYHCASLGGVSQAGLVGMTARGFNVFKRQTRPQGNSGSEDAFRLTPKHGINADLLMTVVRHEAAHQFDRTMSTRQVALRTSLKDDAAHSGRARSARPATRACRPRARRHDSLRSPPLPLIVTPL